MGSFFPTTPTGDDTEPDADVVGLRDDTDVFRVLQSKTARAILGALYQESAVASKLAPRVETSLQNTQYHLDNLHDAGVIEVVDTRYSEKGREMNVYAPASDPLTLVLADPEHTASYRDALNDDAR